MGGEWRGVQGIASVGGITASSVGEVKIKMRKKGEKVPLSILTFYFIHCSY